MAEENQTENQNNVEEVAPVLNIPSEYKNIMNKDGGIIPVKLPDTEVTATTAVTLIPLPNGQSDLTLTSTTVDTNTTMFVGQVLVPFDITVNKVSVRSAGTVTTAGTFDVSLYSEDGQTQLFSVTTASISTTNTVFTTSVSAVSVTAGVYYIAFNSNGTADVVMQFYSSNTGTTEGLPYDVSSEPIIEGSVTISAGAPPSTITPTSVTELGNKTLYFRLDN